MSEKKVIFLQMDDLNTTEEIRRVSNSLKEKIEGYTIVLGSNFHALSKQELMKLLGEMK